MCDGFGWGRSGRGASGAGDQASEEATRLLRTPTRLLLGQHVPCVDLGFDRRQWLLLARVPHRGMGIGVVMNAWDVFRNEEFGEEQIRREVERLQRQG